MATVLYKQAVHPTLTGTTTQDEIWQADCEAIEIINRTGADLWVTVGRFKATPTTPAAEAADTLYIAPGMVRTIPTAAGSLTSVKLLGTGKVSISSVAWGE